MIDEAQNFYLQAKAKYDLLLNFDEKSNDLDEALKKIESRLSEAADKISKLRIKQSKQLKKVIEKELSELGIANVLFEVVFNKEPFSSFGFDKIEFYISPNLGMEPKPLADIISSGEAARVMLGLKKALINVDPVSVLIFDEIDAQIGGRLGTVTGQKLREISRYRQVILITHLPQIASFADRHFKVVKSVRKSLTFTDVILLDSKTRVEELASMLGGQNKKDISLKHAQEMLADAAK
jgi:DNA repair protein RecN (Recombination protein N)